MSKNIVIDEHGKVETSHGHPVWCYQRSVRCGLECAAFEIGEVTAPDSASKERAVCLVGKFIVGDIDAE